MGQDARLGADPLAWLKQQPGGDKLVTAACKAPAEPAQQDRPQPEKATPAPHADAALGAPRTEQAAPAPDWPLEVLARCPAPLMVLSADGDILAANQALADVAGLPLQDILALPKNVPALLAPGPTTLADLAKRGPETVQKLRFLRPQGPGEACAARMEAVASPDERALAFFFSPVARDAGGDGLEDVLETVQGPLAETDANDKAAAELLRTRVLFKSWLMRRQDLLRALSLSPAKLEDALRSCSAELLVLLKLPQEALTLDQVRVDAALPWDQALFLIHLFFDMAALSLRKNGSKTKNSRWSAAISRTENGGSLLNIREDTPGLLRKLKMDCDDKGPMGWLARRVLRKGGALSVLRDTGAEVSVLLPPQALASPNSSNSLA